MPSPLPHSLLLGGTGMLHGLALTLLGRGHRLSVSARRRGSFGRLEAAAQGLPGSLHPLVVDHRDSQGLAVALAEALDARGPAQQAVCWLHGDAPEALALTAQALAARGPCELLHVRGSASADPARGEDLDRARLAGIEGLRYRSVTLGFVVEGGRARWLRDEEIWRGVLLALDSPGPRHVVGQVRPWSLRP